MNFLRWLVLERILPSFSTDNLFVLFVVSLFMGGMVTALFWPWSLPLAMLIVGFWGTIIYVVVAQWLKEMKEEWKQETGGDK